MMPVGKICDQQRKWSCNLLYNRYTRSGTMLPEQSMTTAVAYESNPSVSMTTRYDELVSGSKARLM